MLKILDGRPVSKSFGSWLMEDKDESNSDADLTDLYRHFNWGCRSESRDSLFCCIAQLKAVTQICILFCFVYNFL